MDITDTLAPDSDQLDACDLVSGPQVFTVKSVSKGNAEQPVQVHLVEFPRGPWRPGKNMRRVLAHCWSADASTWVGRRVELYCDPSVRYGSDAVGGTRIAKLSHIDGQQKIPLLISRGKTAVYTVTPLASSTTTKGGDQQSDIPAARQSESVEPQESLLDAITRQIAEIQSEGGGAHLKTWWESIGVGSSKRALIDRFGEGARDLRKLMGQAES